MCAQSLFTHIHIKGTSPRDDYSSDIDSIVLDFFPPPSASMDLHFSEIVALYVCCINIPPLLTNSLLVKE